VILESLLEPNLFRVTPLFFAPNSCKVWLTVNFVRLSYCLYPAAKDAVGVPDAAGKPKLHRHNKSRMSIPEDRGRQHLCWLSQMLKVFYLFVPNVIEILKALPQPTKHSDRAKEIPPFHFEVPLILSAEVLLLKREQFGCGRLDVVCHGFP
jgi:hypothetical protein